MMYRYHGLLFRLCRISRRCRWRGLNHQQSKLVKHCTSIRTRGEQVQDIRVGVREGQYEVVSFWLKFYLAIKLGIRWCCVHTKKKSEEAQGRNAAQSSFENGIVKTFSSYQLESAAQSDHSTGYLPVLCTLSNIHALQADT